MMDTYLLLRAENVGVILLELAHPRQAAQRAGSLISVQNAEISNT